MRLTVGTQTHSDAIRRNQTQSDVIRVRLTVGGLARESRVRSTPQTALSASTSCSVLQLVWAHSVPDEGGNQRSLEAMRGH